MKHKLYLIALLLSVSAISCKKFVEIDPPKTQLVSQTVFENSTTATSAVTVIYSRMVGDGMPYNLPLQSGLYGDELNNYSQGLVPFYLNAVDAKVNSPSGFWTNGYNYIYQANAVIEGCTNSGLNPRIKQQLIAEAQFIRAYWHFYIINLYGDAPLITSTDYKSNSTAARTPAAQVYTQIITDLKSAYTSLNPNYVDISDTVTTTDRVRPNRSAAAAMLARVYLYTGNYPDAEAQATLVINNSNYDTVSLNNAFLKNNREAIWQLMPSTTNSSYNTQEGFNFILDDSPAVCALSNQLMNSFEPGDQRKTQWTSSITVGASTYNFAYKYKVKESTVLTEYSTVLRLAEQYLIRAEARARQGNITGAVTDLNVIRKRAGLPGTTANTQETLLNAILHERQAELFTEWGHRWLDLKRMQKVNDVMSVVTPLKGGTWNHKKALWPIPDADVINDRNLVQNPGYTGGGTGN